MEPASEDLPLHQAEAQAEGRASEAPPVHQAEAQAEGPASEAPPLHQAEAQAEGPASTGEEEVPEDEDHAANPLPKDRELEGRHCIRGPNNSAASSLALESDLSTTATWREQRGRRGVREALEATARAEGWL